MIITAAKWSINFSWVMLYSYSKPTLWPTTINTKSRLLNKAYKDMCDLVCGHLSFAHDASVTVAVSYFCHNVKCGYVFRVFELTLPLLGCLSNQFLLLPVLSGHRGLLAQCHHYLSR